MLYYHHENNEGDFTLRLIAEIVGHVDGAERCFEGPFTISVTPKLLVFRGYSEFNKNWKFKDFPKHKEILVFYKKPKKFKIPCKGKYVV